MKLNESAAIERRALDDINVGRLAQLILILQKAGVNNFGEICVVNNPGKSNERKYESCFSLNDKDQVLIRNPEGSFELLVEVGKNAMTTSNQKQILFDEKQISILSELNKIQKINNIPVDMVLNIKEVRNLVNQIIG